MLGEKLLGDQQGVVHVGAEHRLVPADVGELVGLELAGVGAEADQVEGVARVLHADQVVERHGDLLGRLERSAQGHRPGEIEHDDGGGLGQGLGAVDLEVVGGEPDGHLGAAFRRCPQDGVGDCVFEVQVEWVAEFVGLGVVGTIAVAAGFGDVVLAEVLSLEVGVDLGEGFLADAAVAARSELPGVALFLEVAGLFE